MLTQQQLLDLLTDIESDRVERTASTSKSEVTAANFPLRNSYRNPVIAEAMKSLGFVNRFGYGVQRAQALLKKNGQPPAAFEFDDRTLLVKVYKRPS